jgi:chromosome segregation ATPase
METSLSQKSQIKRRQVGEAETDAEESLRLRTELEVQEREDIRRQAETATTQATRREEDARRVAEIYETGRQWMGNMDRRMGNVEATTRDVNTAVGALTERVSGVEDRMGTVEHQVGELGTQQREGQTHLGERVTNVASRVDGHETRLGGVERRTGTLEGGVQELGREQRQALNNVHQRVTNIEVTRGLLEDRMRGVEGQVGEVANEQHQDHEEYTNLNDRVRNVEAGEANTNNNLVAVQEKQRDMESQMGQLKGWIIGLTIGGVVLGGVALIRWIFGKKRREKRDGSERMEGKSRGHAREWNWGDKDKDW